MKTKTVIHFANLNSKSLVSANKKINRKFNISILNSESLKSKIKNQYSISMANSQIRSLFSFSPVTSHSSIQNKNLRTNSLISNVFVSKKNLYSLRRRVLQSGIQSKNISRLLLSHYYLSAGRCYSNFSTDSSNNRFQKTIIQNRQDNAAAATNMTKNEDSATYQLKPQLQSILSKFDAPIRYAFSYGSGVFKQLSCSENVDNNNNVPKTKKPMVDFIFGVTHPSHWHSLNMRQNPHHYAPLMRMMGSPTVNSIQMHGAGVYFHPFVEVDGVMIKYGVVGMDVLLEDLNNWKTFYLAGRMQKPILVLRDDSRVKLSNRQNLYNAIRTSLFILPSEFTEEDLFLTVAGLSYHGDPRMKYLENPHKVFNIVHAQRQAFRHLYQPIIDDLPIVNYINDDGMLRQEDDLKLKQQNLAKLPKNLLDKVVRQHQQATQTFVVENEQKFQESIIQSGKLEEYIRSAMVDIIAHPARVQSMKGILTAGVSKSIIYLKEKLEKRNKKK